MVTTTLISKHSRTRQGQVDATGRHLGNTTLGHAQYTIVFGKGSNCKSETKHCSEAEIRSYKAQLEAQGF